MQFFLKRIVSWQWRFEKKQTVPDAIEVNRKGRSDSSGECINLSLAWAIGTTDVSHIRKVLKKMGISVQNQTCECDEILFILSTLEAYLAQKLNAYAYVIGFVSIENLMNTHKLRHCTKSVGPRYQQRSDKHQPNRWRSGGLVQPRVSEVLQIDLTLCFCSKQTMTNENWDLYRDF